MTSKCSSSAASGRIDKMASIKRIAVIAAVVLLLSMAVVGAGAAVTVTYDGNGATGGTVPVDSTAYLSGDIVTVMGNTGGLTNGSLVFSGWNTKSDGSGTNYSPYSTFTLTADTILYALWGTKRTVSVTTTDPLSTGGLVTFEYSVDSGTWNTYTEAFIVSTGNSVSLRAVITDCVIRPHDWEVSGSTVTTKDYNTVTFTVENECVYVLAEKGKLLPDGYMELDYIQSTGKQWIDTEVTGAAKTEYDIAFTKVTGRLLMGYSTSGYTYWGVNNGKFEIEQHFSDISCELNKRYDIIHDVSTLYAGKTSLIVDNNVVFSYSYVGDLGEKSIKLLSMGSSNYEYIEAKLYSCVITQHDDVLREFVPCINSVGKIGLYDIVEGNFYTNKDSSGDEFLGGNHVNFGITYDKNCGSGDEPSDSKLYYMNAAVTVLGNTGSLEKTGNKFSGWRVGSSESTTIVYPYQTISMGDSDITLYANWISASTTTCSVTYDENGGTGTLPVDGSAYPSGQPVTVGSGAGLSKTGYFFGWWNTAADGSGTTYLPGGTFNITGNITLYAIWIGHVTYEANGADTGDVPVDENRYTSGSQFTVLGNNTLERSGYVFAGWTLDSKGTGTVYGPYDGLTHEYTMPAGTNVTFYAKWAAPSFTFTIPASVPLKQDTTQKVYGDACAVTIGSNQSVPGKVLRVKVSSDATADLSTEGNPKTIFSLSGTGGTATYKVGKYGTSDYIEGNNHSAAYGNEVVNLDISTGSNLTASQKLFFETVSYDGAGSYSGVLNFAFEVTTKVTGITISGPTAVGPGKSITLTANVLMTDASDKTVTWSSSNETVVEVNETTGEVTGVSPGSATITATANDGSGVEGTYDVTVEGLPVGYMEVEYIESTGTQWINMGVKGDANTQYDIEFTEVKGRKLMGYSTDGSKYWGFANGYFELGGTVSYMKCKANIRYDIIFVYNAAAGAERLLVNNEMVCSKSPSGSVADDSLCLLSLHGVDGYEMKAKLYGCSITQGESIVRDFKPCIRDSGGAVGLYDVVEGKFYGNAITSGDDFKAGPVVDEVTTSVTGIVLDKSSASVKAGETVTLTATVTPTDATYKFVNWSSSDQKVAYVRGGVVTGVKAGTAIITASTVDGGYTATCEVTVSAAAS